MKKKVYVLLIVLAFVATLVLAACNSFVNPGDKLGGGGIGDVANEVDNSANDSAKGELKDRSDLSDLSANTSDEGATKKEQTTDVVEIKKDGAYVFSGAYGGISIAKNVKAHIIFNGVTINSENAIAIEGKSGAEVILTLKEGSSNVITNSGVDADGEAVNAIHIKGVLSINGKGTLDVNSQSKSALKSKNALNIVDATLKLTAANHAISSSSVTAANCNINVLSAGKDGINAECDDYTAQENFTDDGYVSLVNVNYNCDVEGDGIQANTVVYINGGTYNIKTTGNFVQKTTQNMETYGMESDDFKFIQSGGDYKRIASDEFRRYTDRQLFGLSQACKGIKISEVEYSEKDADGNKTTVVVTDANYLIAIDAGTFNINSADDAIHANCGNVWIAGGDYTVSTCDDGITSDVLTKISGGNININKCYEGIEGAYVEISGGVINLVASDDGINASSEDRAITPHIIISGGEVTVDSTGDGIDSNGSILISGGSVVVHGPTSGGDAGLDADKGIVITGGFVFATSTLGMVETPSTNSSQYVVSYAYQSTISADSVISLKDSSGKVLFEMTIRKNCQSIIFSTSDLQKGASYTLYGGSTKLTSFTVSSIITTIGSSGSNFPGGRPGGPGGMGPGGRP